ncbi:MAG: prepilin-type N-terminal cleavage/methylation domain-containing protein [Sedimentisphaerales bacterium]|jgi:prepilin-type N-terminal cleavage/methylation domain-containing protein
MSIQINNPQSAIGNRQSARGFSLTEVLLAVGILAVGMLFIAGVFPVSIYFTTVATERTIAATVADEAFATIKLYGINLADLSTKTNPLGIPTVPQVLVDCQLTSYGSILPENEYAYPAGGDLYHKPYYWSAVYRMVGSNEVQVTLFVCRKTGWEQQYRIRDCSLPQNLGQWYRPVAFPLKITASPSGRPDEIAISDFNPGDGINEISFVNDGYTILDGFSGRIQRVLQRQMPPNDNVLRLDSDWQGGSPGLIWVVPPPVNGGRYPCIGVYQKVMRF